MKKHLFLFAAAAVVLASCSSDDTIAENSSSFGNQQQKEIALFPLATPTTRAAVDGTTFDPGTPMKVTAYNATAGENFFGATTFSYSSSTWKGSKYWPFTPATINFLAIANANADNATNVTWGPTISAVTSNPTEKVEIVMSDNSTDQRDLMYACGTGTVSQSGNTLTFPPNVPMVFKHAQAWVKFTLKASDATAASAITVNKITLNSVSCNGTYLVTHTNWNNTTEGSVSGVWSDYTPASNIDAVAASGSFTLSTSEQDFASLMVVPNQGMASFTINYTIDGKTYDYTYTPASTSLAQATKYTYDITLTLHEIEIAPTVTNWTPYDFDDVTGGQQDQDVSL